MKTHAQAKTPSEAPPNHVGHWWAQFTASWFSFLPGLVVAVAVWNASLPSVQAAAGMKVAIYVADNPGWESDVREKIMRPGFFTQVDVFFAQSGNPVPRLNELQGYDAVLVYSDAGFGDATGLGNVLADYLDGGGGVVIAVFALADGNIALRGRIRDAGYLPLLLGQASSGTRLVMVKDQPSHPVLEGVASFDGGDSGYRCSPTSVTAGAELVAHWSDGQPLVAVHEFQRGKIVALNFFPPSSDARSDFWRASTDGGRLMANALRWAGSPQAPVIATQPRSQTAGLGGTASLTVLAEGAPPLNYKWSFSGTEIPGATSSVLLLTNVQLNFAGDYSVVVANALGAATSQVATLTVIYDLEQPLMANGLAAHYPLDGNADDAGPNRNNGVNLGAVLASDKVGAVDKAYAFNGLDSGIYIRNSDSLNLRGSTSLSIAAWIKPAKVNQALQVIVAKWGLQAQFALALAKDRLRLVVADPGKDLVSRGALTAGGWVHVAGVYDAAAGRLRVYINGNLDNERAASLALPATAEPVYIGKGACAETGFEGAIDDVWIYSRALSTAEIELLSNSGIWITDEPTATVATWGKSAALSVGAQSTRPLTYQWLKDGQPITGANSPTLALSTTELTDGGNYTVLVGNGMRSLLTAPAALTVRPAETSIALYPGVTIDGVVGRTYRVEYATELNPDVWMPVFTNTLTTPRLLWYDSQAATEAKRFYKVVAVP